MKTSNPKRFPVSRKTKSGKNSGIFSDSGAGQKKDPQVKPSVGKKADKSILKQAVTVPKKKSISKRTKSRSVGDKTGVYEGMTKSSRGAASQKMGRDLSYR